MSQAELDNYRQQISVIDGQLGSSDITSEERQELDEMRNDLMELVSLLQEEIGDNPSTSSTDNYGEEISLSAQEYIDRSEYDEFVGMRCHAPFPRFNLPLSSHAAVVLEVLPPKSAETGITALVLYSNPMIAAMRPCPHFLSGKCRFEEKCKFSHGEEVPMTSLEEYKEPDFSNVLNGSLVLILEDGLWQLGRLVTRDGDQLAVRLLKSGTEVASSIELILPIEGDIEDPDVDGLSPSTEKNDSWSELKGSSLGRVTVGDMGNWNGGGIGLKLMQKMGYSMGEGLGKNSDGIVHAVQATICPKNKSLDECMNRKKKVVDGMDEQKTTKARLKKQMESSSNSLDCDIFAFLNRKLEQKPIKTEKEIILEEKKSFEKSSSKDLGIRSADLDSQLKELRSKQKKLNEGITRNKNDKRTVEKMQIKLQEVQKDIEKIEAKHGRLHSEMNDRHKKKKDIF